MGEKGRKKGRKNQKIISKLLTTGKKRGAKQGTQKGGSKKEKVRGKASFLPEGEINGFDFAEKKTPEEGKKKTLKDVRGKGGEWCSFLICGTKTKKKKK